MNNERFRKALDAKIGDWITSKYPSVSDARALTKGNLYEIMKAPEPCYFNGRMCNVFVLIIDDKGRKVEVPYLNFEELEGKE